MGVTAMPRGGNAFDPRGGEDSEVVSVAQLRRLLGLGTAPKGGGRGAQAAGGGGGKGGGGAGGGRGPQERRGRRQPSGAGGGTAEVARREGDWDCPSCGFAPNFTWKARCFRCGAARPRGGGARGARGAADGGPVGAAGRRPLLPVFASRAEAAANGAPAYRPPGASLAARAAATSAGGRHQVGGKGSEKGAGLADGARAPARTASAGHAPGTSGAPREQAAGAAAAAGAPAAGQGGSAYGVGQHQQQQHQHQQQLSQPRARWADEEVPWDRRCGGGGGGDEGSDCYMDDDAALDDEDEEDGYAEGGGGDDEGPTVEQLRQAWTAECRAVRALESQGRHQGSAALAAAKEARDAAEAAWRSAVGPQPLSRRMGRAQQRLDKAAKALERARLDLEEFDEQAEARRDELRRRIDEAEQRYWTRHGQMDELHWEAGELASASGAAPASRRTSDDVCDMVVAELQSWAEDLGEGSETWNKVNLLLSKMATAAGGGGSGPQRYNLAEADDEHVGEAGCGPQESGLGGKAVSWEADAKGRWNRRGAGTSEDGEAWRFPRKPVRLQGRRGGASADGNTTGAACPMGDGVPQAEGPQEREKGGPGSQSGVPREGEGQAATRPGGQPSQHVADAVVAAGGEPKGGERQAKPGGKRGAEDEEEGQPPKSHRGEDVEQSTSVELGGDDAARAQKLYQEQQIAMWAARNAQSIFGDAASRAIAGQLYAHKTQLVEERARAIGLDPTSEGKGLIDLAPEDFMAWVDNVLVPAERQASEARDL